MSIKNSLLLSRKYKLALSTIHMVYRLINSTYNLKELVLRLAKLICQVLDADSCSICLLDPAKKKPLFRALVSKRTKVIVEKGCHLNNGVEGKIIKVGQAVLKENIIGVPLLSEDTVGCILIKRKRQKPHFDVFDQEILIAISEQAVTAIRNLQLYETQQRIMLGSIKSLVLLLDKRVPGEYAHTRVFSELVVDLAKQMHLSELEVHSLQYASLLHDAGKIDIPQEILTKTSKLTSKEYGIIKAHPLMGAQIVKHVESLRPIVPIILYHHEKYDGTGYPSGLKKGQIPLGARIMAVADAFEAMISGRPYRGMVSLAEAIAEIKNNSGTQFDPKVVEAFLGLVKKRKFKKYLRIIRR
ncbi:MAG: HD domain-containing phosphohydrolase [Candidatus Omnitrophota bacterium]|nr:HD domain-containing phosphohydrolase [Candidatus Omnitrophota bacterium]